MIRIITIIIIALSTTACTRTARMQPFADTSKWVEYQSTFDQFMINYKYPTANGIKKFDQYKYYIDTGRFSSEKFFFFVMGRYDWLQYPHYELSIMLSKYDFNITYNATPDAGVFSNDIILEQDKLGKKVGISFDSSIVQLNGISYMHIIFYDDAKRIRAEVYRAPLTKSYYISIEASYEAPLAQDPAWLASRRKIFQDFAEGVRLSNREPAQVKPKSE